MQKTSQKQIISVIIIVSLGFSMGFHSFNLSNIKNEFQENAALEIQRESDTLKLTENIHHNTKFDYQMSQASQYIIENRGQIPDSKILYYFQGDSILIGFGISTIFIIQQDNTTQELEHGEITFLNSNPIKPLGTGFSNAKYNYFVGPNIITDVPLWTEIIYNQIYSGIDLKYTITAQGLKYAFIVNPSGDPSQIRVLGSEDLKFTVTDTFVQIGFHNQQNYILQDIGLEVFQADGIQIHAEFNLLANIGANYGFAVATFDRAQELTIDPWLLEYSSYLGGTGEERPAAVSVDNEGNLYVVGYTDNIGFPFTVFFNTTNPRYTDAYITKINATGNGLIYSTFIGGYEGGDEATDIEVDADGNAYVVGYTSSSSFPKKNSNKTTVENVDGFIILLNSTGNGLNFSIIYGGTSSDWFNGIELDTNGNIYTLGITSSTNLPTFNAYQASSGGSGDFFFAKFNQTANGLEYCTYLGGSEYDSPEGFDIDLDGNAYGTGDTYSSNFPTFNGLNSSQVGSYDGVIVKLNATGNGLIYSTYWGGTGNDWPQSIVSDAVGNAYITGYTDSSNFPLKNPIDAIYNSREIFITKLNATGNNLEWSTFFGSSDSDHAGNIVLDEEGDVWICGDSWTSNYPLKNEYDTWNGGISDFIVTEIDALGNDYKFSTYIGSIGADYEPKMAMDSNGNLYLAGCTDSPSFPLLNEIDNTYGGGPLDTVYLKLSINNKPLITLISPANESVCLGNAGIDLSISDSEGLNYTSYQWDAELVNSFPAPYDINLPMMEGEHFLTIFANDSLGNNLTKTFKFVTDGSAPVITLHSPSNNTIQHSGTILDFTIDDVAGCAQILYRWDTGLNNVFNSPWDLSLIAGDGVHMLYIFAQDNLGFTINNTYFFTTSDNPPIVSLISPSNYAYILPSQIIDLNIIDSDGLGPVIYKWDTGNFYVLSSPWDISVVGIEGLHILTVIANDSLGNSITIIYHFTVDISAPMIQIETPMNGSTILNGSKIDLSIIDLDPGVIVTYNWNGTNNVTLTAPYDIIVNLGFGTHILTIFARDSNGNYNSTCYTFVIVDNTYQDEDNPPPTVDGYFFPSFIFISILSLISILKKNLSLKLNFDK